MAATKFATKLARKKRENPRVKIRMFLNHKCAPPSASDKGELSASGAFAAHLALHARWLARQQLAPVPVLVLVLALVLWSPPPRPPLLWPLLLLHELPSPPLLLLLAPLPPLASA